jgi:uroporphyrinogen-III synthase
MYMVADLPLNGLKVLVTRPQTQATVLSDLIAAQGGIAIPFPVITIKKLTTAVPVDNKLTGAAMIIFVSRNAVNYFIADVESDLANTIQCVAIGKGTAEAMQEKGLRVDLQPEKSVGSEGLLAIPELEDVSGKKIVIVRGKGGRELLADTLIARGATISYIEVYERCIASPSEEQCAAALLADTIVCTSVAGVTNLKQLLKNNIETVLIKPLIVLSERIKQHAISLGFKQVNVSADASDQAIMQRLMEMEK